MKSLLFVLLCGFPVGTGCFAVGTGVNPFATIGAIPLRAGYHRVSEDAGSFGAWLRGLPLKKSLTVYLYNGKPKQNQDAQFAVLDIPVGHEDLQQCADAVMRLRAEYLYSRGQYGSINFYSEQGIRLSFGDWADKRRAAFDKYLREVFMYCSTRTLAKQLVRASFDEVEPGDVLIRSGSPGHAMLVVDVAEDRQGHRIFLLAQSYMPAQDVHVVRNPDDTLSPWYRADSSAQVVETPEYEFKTNELRTWRK
jgi:hypothetical protein